MEDGNILLLDELKFYKKKYNIDFNLSFIKNKFIIKNNIIRDELTFRDNGIIHNLNQNGHKEFENKNISDFDFLPIILNNNFQKVLDEYILEIIEKLK